MGGSARFGGGEEDGAFGDERGGWFERAPLAGAFEAAGAGEERVAAARPIDGVGSGGGEEGEQPIGGLGGFGGGRGGEDERGQMAGDDFGHFAMAPAEGAFAAEAGIGEQAEGGANGGGPAVARFVVEESGGEPQAGAFGEFEAGGGVGVDAAGFEAVDGGAGAERGAKGAEAGAFADGEETFAGAVENPAVLFNGKTGDERGGERKRDEARAFIAQLGRGRRGPEMIGRRDEQGVAVKREAGAEGDGGAGGVFGGGGEPVLDVAEAQTWLG